MSLAFHPACARCARPTGPFDVAFICGHEHTFCEECARSAGFACPACRGELARRPRRMRMPRGPDDQPTL